MAQGGRLRQRARVEPTQKYKSALTVTVISPPGQPKGVLNWSTAGIFTFKDVNTLCVWGVFVGVIGRSEEPSFWFLYPCSTLTCRLHPWIVLHWNIWRKVIDNSFDQRISEQKRKAWLRWFRFTCCILLCCPRQPKYEKTCNNWKEKGKCNFNWKAVTFFPHSLFQLKDGWVSKDSRFLDSMYCTSALC